jgi:hypothetical protein
MLKRILFAIVSVALLTTLASCGPASSPGASNSSSSGSGATGNFARYLAADTPMFVSVNPQISGDQATNWTKISDAFKSIPDLAKSLDQTPIASTPGNVNWDTDVKPWVGDDLGFVLTDLTALAGSAESKDTSTATSAAEQNMLLAVQIKDQAKYDAFIAKYRSDQEKAGSKFSDETYKDVKITSGTVNSSQSAAYAVVNGYFVFSGKADAIKALIDRGEPKDSLLNSAKFKTVIDKLPADRMGFGYMDYEGAMKNVSSSLPASQQALLTESQSLTAVAFSWQATADGLKVDYVGSVDQTKLSASAKELASLPASANKAAGLAPDNTMLYLSSQDLKAIWDSLKSAQGTSGGANVTDSLTKMQTALGVDLDKDVFSWMTGEFALAVMPAKSSGISMLPVEGALIVEVKDKTTAQNSLKTITDSISAQGMTFSEKDVKGVKVQAMDAAGAGMSICYGFVGDFLVVASSTDTMSAVIDASNGTAKLSDNAEFKMALANLPKENNGLVYADVTKLSALDLSGLLGSMAGSTGSATPSDQTSSAKAALAPMKSIAFSGISATDFVSGGMFMHISK